MKSTTFFVIFALLFALNQCAPVTSTDTDLDEATTDFGSETTVAISSEEPTPQTETAAPSVSGGSSPKYPVKPGANGGISGYSPPDKCRNCFKPTRVPKGANSLKQSEEQSEEAKDFKEIEQESNESDEDSGNGQGEGSRKTQIINHLKSKLVQH